MDKRDRIGLGCFLAAMTMLLAQIAPPPECIMDHIFQISSDILALAGIFLLILRKE